MTNDQRIAVAEEVWGWTRLTEENFSDWCTREVWELRIITHIDEANRDSWGKDSLPERVKSWQGFGRTVEAMAEMNNMIEINSCLIIFKSGDTHSPRGKSLLLEVDESYSQRIIEHTHLAALDAVREEKS